MWWLMVSNDLNSVTPILFADQCGQVEGEICKDCSWLFVQAMEGEMGPYSCERVGNARFWKRFSQEFESVPVSGETAAGLSGKSLVNNWKVFAGWRQLLFAWPEKKDELSLSHRGKGKTLGNIQSLAAIPLKESLSSGYKIKKTVTPVEQKLSANGAGVIFSGSGSIWKPRLTRHG